MVIGSDGVWDVMSSAEVCGFVLKHEPKENVAEALVNCLIYEKVGECRSRWDE